MKINVKKNGPCVITFEKPKKVKIKKGDKVEEMELHVVALCRCGGSKNMPLCDGTHKEINFQAEEQEIEIL